MRSASKPISMDVGPLAGEHLEPSGLRERLRVRGGWWTPAHELDGASDVSGHAGGVTRHERHLSESALGLRSCLHVACLHEHLRGFGEAFCRLRVSERQERAA